MTLEKNRAEFWGVEGAESRESETGQGFSVSWGKRKWSTIDANGSITSDNKYSYKYDAENRLVQVSSLNPTPATVADTILMTYDGLCRRVSITEEHGSTILTAKTFVWCGPYLCQERDSTGHTVTKQFFNLGEQISGTNYYYTKDHLGNVREMTDSGGVIHANYDYDPYGRQVKLSGDLDSDFGYAGTYLNRTSGLCLTWARAYDPNKGRWLNRDPLGEGVGINLYEYVLNNPVRFIDPLGFKWYGPPENVPYLPGEPRVPPPCQWWQPCWWWNLFIDYQESQNPLTENVPGHPKLSVFIATTDQLNLDAQQMSKDLQQATDVDEESPPQPAVNKKRCH